MLPVDFPNVELEEMFKLKIYAEYVEELQVSNMQKAIAKALKHQL